MNNKLKVMIVDDSPVFRALLTEIVESDPQLTVVATAENPYEARDLIKQHNPDVLTLDIEMPKMNGVQFLKNLMRLRPMPVVMISTLTQHGADITLEALEIGAVDYFPKPAVENTAEMIHYKQMVNAKIKMAAGANVKQGNGAHQVEKQQKVKQKSKKFDLIAIGASTGGTEAVRSVLSALPSNLPPIVITQHISAMFTPSFAQRLDAASELTVRDLAVDSAPLVNGCAYVAPGDKHMVIVKRGGCLYCELDDRPPVNRHKPSVDVMFDAVAETLGNRAIGIILTGMGQDGAEGMLNMKNAGAYTIAQDEQSSVVWGMPRVAVEVGAVEKVVSLNRVPRLICDTLFST